jgi:hypothetical protein
MHQSVGRASESRWKRLSAWLPFLEGGEVRQRAASHLVLHWPSRTGMSACKIDVLCRSLLDPLAVGNRCRAVHTALLADRLFSCRPFGLTYGTGHGCCTCSHEHERSLELVGDVVQQLQKPSLWR